MGLLLLCVTLVAASAVIGLGVWGMVRIEASLGEPEDSVLAHWVVQQRAAGGRRPGAGRTASPLR